MDEIQIELIDGRFNVNEMLSRVSNKTLQDYKNTDIYQSLIENDNSAIMNGMCKAEYFNSLLYWACPKIAFLIENHKPWRHIKDIVMKEGGSLYLIRISEHLYKYGRTKNIKKRLQQYTKGSTLLCNEYIDDVISGEKILLNTVKEYADIFHGNEYFYLDNDKIAIDIYKKGMNRILSTCT